MRGVSIADKLKLIANNTPLVCANLGTTETKTASGNPIIVTDVSSIEHELDVKLTSKNLFDKNTLYDFYCDGSGTIVKNNNMRSVFIPIESSGSIVITQPKASTFMRYGFTTELPQHNTQLLLINGRYYYTYTNGSVITLDNPLCKYIVISFWRNTSSYTLEETIEDLQIEFGSTATAYTPYISDFSGIEVKRFGENLYDEYIATANSEGIVKGLTSVSPNMTLLSDEGIIIECSYRSGNGNPTADEKFTELQNAFANAKEMIKALSGKWIRV